MALEERIYEAAAKAAPPGADEQTLRMLCRAAEALWRARLRKDVSEEDCADAFVCAAAWTALGTLLTRPQMMAQSVESFTVGEISVRSAAGTGSAEAATNGYFSRAERLMRPFCTGSGFSFLGVRG